MHLQEWQFIPPRKPKSNAASKRNPKVKRVRHADIARLAGVSRTTVSYVLNHREDVTISEATRERVFGAAKKLSYRQNELARSLASGKTQTIGVLTPRLDMTFHADVINGVQHTCREQGYRVLLGYSHNDDETEKSELRLLLQHQVDGIILIAAFETCDRLHLWLGDAIGGDQVPCVVLDHAPPGNRFDYVISDDRSGAMAAVNHLIELGHRRIACVRAAQRSSPAVDRFEGYRLALSAAGLPLDPELIAGSNYHPEDGARAVEDFLALADPPTAIFATSDYSAAGALQALNACGVSVPDQMAMVGFGDAGFATFLSLTTVRRTPLEMGQAATQRLLERLKDPSLTPAGIIMPTQLVVRQSSGAQVR